MPNVLMMLDLDNTLIDRDAAFRRAGAAFLAEHRLPAEDLGWIMATDASGYTPRPVLVEAIVERYGGDVTTEAAFQLTDTGAVDHVELAGATAQALVAARAVGWRLVIVTNGRGHKQLAKIRKTGLDGLVDGWVISEDLGVKKPDARIFAAAAAQVAAKLDGGWMIGDSPRLDVGGAHALGLRSVWVRAGEWPADVGFRPTHTAETAAEAIRYVVAAA